MKGFFLHKNRLCYFLILPVLFFLSANHVFASTLPVSSKEGVVIGYNSDNIFKQAKNLSNAFKQSYGISFETETKAKWTQSRKNIFTANDQENSHNKTFIFPIDLFYKKDSSSFTNISKQTAEVVSSILSTVGDFVSNIFMSKVPEVVKLQTVKKSSSSKSSSSVSNIVVATPNLNSSQSSTHNPQPITYNRFYNLPSSVTKREVLDLIKQYDDNNKNLIYATNAITTANSSNINQTLFELKNKIQSLEQKESLAPRQLDHVYNSISRSFDNITSLDGVTVTNSSFSGTTGTFSGNLTVSGASTSTFSGGLSANRFSSTATSTLAGLVLSSQGLTISTLDCSASGQLLQTDASGNVVCGTDDTSAGLPTFTAGYFTATSTTASTFPYASTTAITATTASTTNLIVSDKSYLGTVSSGIWNGSSIGNSYIDDDITLTNITQITNRAITDTIGTLTVARGGTGQTSFGQGWLHSDGTTLTSSTSPTVAYLTATSTTATTTFAGGLDLTSTTGNGLNFGSNTLWYQNNQPFLISSTTSAGNLTIGYQSASQLDANGGLYNTGVGYQAMQYATSSPYNTALGYQALKGSATISNTGRNTAVGYQSLYSNTTGTHNTANGYQSLYSNTTGYYNTANGYRSLSSNTTGTHNTANGMYSLYSNTTGYYNIANGYQSLYSNTTGYNNTANGFQSLYSNTTGVNNTANGMYSLYSNTTGGYNTANGVNSLYSNTTGNNNTANGYQSLYSNTTGYNNTANGFQSLYSNTTGNNNIANGYQSLFYNSTGNYNAANGSQSLVYNTTGTGNIGLGYFTGYGDGTTVDQRSVIDNYATFIGYQASRDASVASTSALTNITAIGKSARVGASNSIVLGGIGADAVKVGIGTTTPWRNLSVVGTMAVNGLTSGVAGDFAVCINNTTKEITNAGSTGCVVSSKRFKENISTLDLGLNELMKLKPSKFTYIGQMGEHIGLIAEDVDMIDKRLVEYESDGITPRTVRYMEISALLIKSIQDLNLKVDNLSIASTSVNNDLQANTFASGGQGSEGLFGWIVDKFKAMLGIGFEQGKLCLEDVCINKTQLKELLDKNNISQISSSVGQASSHVSSGESSSSVSASVSSQSSFSFSSLNSSSSQSSQSSNSSESQSASSESSSSSIPESSSSESSSVSSQASSTSSESLSSSTMSSEPTSSSSSLSVNPETVSSSSSLTTEISSSSEQSSVSSNTNTESSE